MRRPAAYVERWEVAPVELTAFLAGYPLPSTLPTPPASPPSERRFIEEAKRELRRTHPPMQPLSLSEHLAVLRTASESVRGSFPEFLAAREHALRELRPPPPVSVDPTIRYFENSSEWYATKWGHILDDLVRRKKHISQSKYSHFLNTLYAPWANDLYAMVMTQMLTTVQAADAYLEEVQAEADTPPPLVAPRSTARFAVDATLRTPTAKFRAVEREMQRMTALVHAARFHLLQRFWQVSWHSALFPQHGDQSTARSVRDRINRSRSSLGREAVDLTEMKLAALELEEVGHPAATPLRRAINGALAEIDAGTVLFDFLRVGSRDRVFVFPATPTFERHAGRANIDFLLVDFRKHHALGIQVKASEQQSHTRSYDSERVRMLYSDTDFDGYNLQGDRIAPWPGSISIRYLATTQYTDLLAPHLAHDEFLRYKERATDLLPTTVSGAGQHLRDLAASTRHAQSGTALRPARPRRHEDIIRDVKRAERSKFDRATRAVYERLVRELYA